MIEQKKIECHSVSPDPFFGLVASVEFRLDCHLVTERLSDLVSLYITVYGFPLAWIGVSVRDGSSAGNERRVVEFSKFLSSLGVPDTAVSFESVEDGFEVFLDKDLVCDGLDIEGADVSKVLEQEKYVITAGSKNILSGVDRKNPEQIMCSFKNESALLDGLLNYVQGRSDFEDGTWKIRYCSYPGQYANFEARFQAQEWLSSRVSAQGHTPGGKSKLLKVIKEDEEGWQRLAMYGVSKLGTVCVDRVKVGGETRLHFWVDADEKAVITSLKEDLCKEVRSYVGREIEFE